MNESLVTVRYAKALFQLAREEGKTEGVREDIRTVLSCIEDSKEFTGFLESPLIKSGKKQEVMDAIFQGKVSELTHRFLELLIQNKRENLLHFICVYYLKLYKIDQGIQEGTLTTATELSKEGQQAIHNYIEKKFKATIDIENKTDPSIIGGFVLRIEDKQINASLSAQLKKIKRELINS